MYIKRKTYPERAVLTGSGVSMLLRKAQNPSILLELRCQDELRLVDVLLERGGEAAVHVQLLDE